MKTMRSVLLTLLVLLLLPAWLQEPERSPSVAADSWTDRPPFGPRVGRYAVNCTVYVAPGGDDGAAGAAEAPWRTLQHAADVAQPGQTICARAGTYSEDEVSLTRSGLAGAPITLAASPGEAVTLRGQLTVRRGVAHVEVIGLTLRNFGYAGVSVAGDNRHLRLAHLDALGGDTAIRMTEGGSGNPPEQGPVSDIVVEDSVFRDAVYTAVDCTPGPCDRLTFRRLEISGSGLQAGFGGDGLAVERGRDVLVEDSYIHDNGGDGIDLNSRDFAGNMPGIVVRRNRVARNHRMGIKLWASGRAENNVVWGQGLNPVVAGIHPGTYELVNNVVAFNNYDPAYAARSYAFVAGYEQPPVPMTVRLVNNLFAFNTGPQLGDPAGIYLGAGVQLTEHHNLYWSRHDGEIEAAFVSGRDPTFSRSEITGGAWTASTGQGQGDLVADPLFAAGWPNVDLLPRAGSPAIDTGTNQGCPATDQRGAGRPADGNGDGSAICDVGAFEVSGQPGPGTPTVTQGTIPATCSPRPSIGILTLKDGPGRLRVQVTARSNASAPNNRLVRLRFGRADNGLIDIAGRFDIAGNVTIELPDRPEVMTFYVRRMTTSAATTVHYTVVDACGDWPTFVGGGPTAF